MLGFQGTKDALNSAWRKRSEGGEGGGYSSRRNFSVVQACLYHDTYSTFLRGFLSSRCFSELLEIVWFPRAALSGS